MVYFKDDKDNIIIPTDFEIKNGENRDKYFYEHKINTFYLRLILEILTKNEFNIFLASMKFIIHDSPGYPLYYGYKYFYDKDRNCASYYDFDNLSNMLCDKDGLNKNNVKKTIKKLIKAHVIIPKKSYVTINNDIGYVLFINESILTYENEGMGVGCLEDLKYDENNIVILESYCELPYSYYHPEFKMFESQVDRNSKESKEWVNKIKERANYICQCCGSTERKGMSSHHIKNWATYPDLRCDLSNGMCLCNDCHNPFVKGSFHNTYGTRNNTPEQLQEYIDNKRDKLGLPRITIEEIVNK